MRGYMTPQERKLWEELRDGRFHGIPFEAQKPFGPYVLDFYDAGRKLAIEVDGPIHNARWRRGYDGARDGWLSKRGITVVRIKNETIDNDFEWALERIRRHVGISKSMDLMIGRGVGIPGAKDEGVSRRESRIRKLREDLTRGRRSNQPVAMKPTTSRADELQRAKRPNRPHA